MELLKNVIDAAHEAASAAVSDIMNEHGESVGLAPLRWGPLDYFSRLIVAQASESDYPPPGVEGGTLDVAQSWARVFRMDEINQMVPGIREWGGYVENCEVRIWFVSDRAVFDTNRPSAQRLRPDNRD